MTPPFAAGPRAAGFVPRDVQLAYQLFIGSVVLGVLAVALQLALVGTVIDALLRQTGTTVSRLTPEEQALLESGVRTGTIVAVAIAVILIALYLYFAFQMRSGMNWARIVLTALGAFTVLYRVIAFAGSLAFAEAGPLGVALVVLGLLQAIMIIVAVVFMYRPDANAYFAAIRT